MKNERKEELKDEVKNRISMALKDPILQQGFEIICKENADLKEENAELRKVADFQQSSNMNRHFENNKLKEGLAVGSTFNKALNSMNKNLEEERDKYRNMVFDKDEQLTKAKEIIKKLYSHVFQGMDFMELNDYNVQKAEAEQFISEVEKCGQ